MLFFLGNWSDTKRARKRALFVKSAFNKHKNLRLKYNKPRFYGVVSDQKKFNRLEILTGWIFTEDFFTTLDSAGVIVQTSWMEKAYDIRACLRYANIPVSRLLDEAIEDLLLKHNEIAEKTKTP